MSDIRWQFIDDRHNEIDAGINHYAKDDATSVRAWQEDYPVMEVERTSRGKFRIVYPAVSNRLAGRRFETPRDALDALEASQASVPAGSIKMTQANGQWIANVPVPTGGIGPARALVLTRRAACRAINRKLVASGAKSEARTMVYLVMKSVNVHCWAQFVPTAEVVPVRGKVQKVMVLSRVGLPDSVFVVVRNRRGQEWIAPNEQLRDL